MSDPVPTGAARLVFSVFKQAPRRAAEEYGELVEGGDVEAFHVALLEQPVGHGQCKSRPLSELVGVLDAPAVEPGLELPANRHGLTVASNPPLDKTNGSIRFISRH